MNNYDFFMNLQIFKIKNKLLFKIFLVNSQNYFLNYYFEKYFLFETV